jgi:hypothetical protein
MKMTHRHTQSPWHVGVGNGSGEIFAESGRMRLELGGTTLYPIAQMVRGWDESEDDANARLIAAAPELLEACMVALAAIKSEYPLEHGNPTIGRAWGTLESAIEKATSNI